MLQRTIRRWSKRTPGYVFWRQNTLIELEHSKRSYLMNDTKIPVAEVARRMVRVKSRYQEASDYHEKSLLRGEYKYFTGKLCDLRAARMSDMIALLQCGAFFGFWDAAQVEAILRELKLRAPEMRAAELVAVFASLPGLRKQASDAFIFIAKELVETVPELTMEECLQVLAAACTEKAPLALLNNIMVRLESEASCLSASQRVDVLDALSSVPEAVRAQFRGLWDILRTDILHENGDDEPLDPIALSIVYMALKSHGDLLREEEDVIFAKYTQQLPATCPRSSAMMFAALHHGERSPVLHSEALSFVHAMEKRVVFLATDYSPSELLTVLRTYLEALMSIIGTLLPEVSTGPAPGIVLRSGGGMGLYTAEESLLATQRRKDLGHVVRELSDQLLVLMEGAATYTTSAEVLDVMEIFAVALERAGSDDAAAELLREVPLSRRVLRMASSRLIASLRAASAGELLRLLDLCSRLGPSLVEDALVAGAVQELVATRRSYGGAFSAQDAAVAVQLLGSLDGLRPAHQKRLNADVVPRLKQRISHAAE